MRPKFDRAPASSIKTMFSVAGTTLLASPRNQGGVTVVESSLGDNANSFILPGYALLNGMIAYTTKIEAHLRGLAARGILIGVRRGSEDLALAAKNLSSRRSFFASSRVL